jgi:flagellin-like hook-associated protein FlgL
VFETISNDMKTGNTTNLGTDLQNLDTNMSTLQGLQANVGATESRLSLASSRIADLQLSTTQILSNDEDVDMARP